MHEVEVTVVVEPSSRELLSTLSPRAILESAEIYDVRSLEPTADGERAVVTFEDQELTITFLELENGYQYTFVDGGDMFAKRYSTITVEGGDETRVEATTRYTFDSFWSFVLDRLAAKTVTRELETTITNLVEKAAGQDADATASSESLEGATEGSPNPVSDDSLENATDEPTDR